MPNLNYNKLNPDQIQSELKTTANWEIKDGALTKSFSNNGYARAACFAMAIAHLAEALNHHPDITLTYSQLTVSMITHDADGGLTTYDFELARRIDKIN